MSGRRVVAVAILCAASLASTGCALIAKGDPDPVHAEKISQLERRMDRVESRLPPPPPPPPPSTQSTPQRP
jgi:hypothetical protein